jgi:hypothetical protein
MDYRTMREQARNRQMSQQLVRRLPPQSGADGNAGRQLQQKFSQGILAGIQPGNIGDINRVIWTFAFQFQSQNGAVADIAPGQSQTLSFSVTQEAGFLMRTMSHSTFRLVGSNYEYIDPFYFDESVNSPNGLTYTLQDAVSSRLFTGALQGRTSKEISLLGNANFPWVYPSTVFLLPNQTMLLNLTNSGTETFRTFVTVWGYRIRVEDAQKILSTVQL